MSDRNAEIWSTRLQREILALESSDDESKKIELLPPFIKTIGHTLSIEGGIAKIEFRIDVEVPENIAGGGEDDDEEVVDSAATSGEEKTVQSVGEKKVDGEDSNEENAVAKDEKEGGDIAQKDESTGDEKDTDTDGTESKDTTTTEDGSPQEKVEEKADPHVVLVLDASLYWRPDSASSSQSTSPQCYPFQKPLAIVKYGSNLFSGGSTIQNGDEVDIDLDWTPSIHLSDAVTNVALKIRECIKRGEPLHATVKEDNDDDGLSGSILREAREAKESLLETKKAAVAIFSSGLSSLSAKGSSFAAKGESASKRMSKGILNLGESLSTIAAPTMLQGEDTTEETEAAAGGEEGSAKEESNIKVVKEIPDIGDEIDLSDDPWNKCIGMYSCKAIKRPEFIEALLSNSATNQKEVSGSMFSRFAKSAKSAMEETFLMITDKCIIEFKSSRLNIGSGTVTFAISIDQMAKLKFRREESLSLFFKPASDDPLVYMCLDSALAVHDIQNVLKSHGVKGKHTNAATQRSVQMALNLVALIQQKEKELIDSPTVDRVNEIMDLYRQAAEKFEVAGDPRHTEVMAHMKRFLNQQFTTSILDGTFAKKIEQTTVTNSNTAQDERKVPDGEILEAPTYNLSNDDDDDDDDHVAADPVEDKGDTPTKDAPDDLNDSTLQNMEDMLNEAVKDMKDVGMEDDDINDILTSPPKQSTGDGKDDIAEHDDTFAELDAMLSDADAELNELLNS